MAQCESYPECFLGSVVDPGEYWLVSKLKTHVRDVKAMEEMLSDEMNQVLTTPDPQLLVPHCCVAVQNASAKGNWQRGKIIKKLEKDVYTVFLVDCGHFTDVGITHLQLIEDRKYLEVEPLAFRFLLYGVVPFIVTDDLKKKVSESWSSSAKEFIGKLFSQRLLIYVKKVEIINRIVFGDLYLVDKPNVPPFSMGKLLCMKEYGVYAESYFKKKVMGNYSTKSGYNIFEKHYLGFTPDVSMKIDRVKEWHLSTAQHQEINHGDTTGVLKAPSDGISDGESDTMNISFASNRNETPLVTVADSRKQSLNGEVSREPVVNVSGVGCSGNVQSTVCSPRTRNDDSAATRKISLRRDSVEKKEFNMVLEDNVLESRRFEDDSGVGIFTFFSDSIVEPINKLRNLNISRSIVSNLERQGNFNNLSPIQRWAIPSIQRGHNVVIIGSAKTGKTLSYLIPILAILQDRVDAEEVPVGNGPVAIIVCSGSRSCDVIHYICHTLLRNRSQKGKAQVSVRVEVVYGSSREKKSWVQLTNGCELLISTPHCLARLLKHRTITNLERLDYLILDEVDVIVQEPFLSPIKIILHQSKLSKNCQRVFCGEQWAPELRCLINSFAKSHTILIGSYLEAAIYAKLKPNVMLVDKEKKSEIILDAMLPHIGTCKILIACEYTSEVLQLCQVFEANGHSPLVAHSDMVVHDIKVLERRWKSATYAPVLICSDDVIHRLAIDDAEMLVHYSLPSESKTNFGKRFSAVIKGCDKYPSEEGSPRERNVLVLIDDENHYQLPHVVDFVSRLGGKIPEKIKELSREISWRIETNKKDISICQNLLEFGECKNVKNCNRRHAFINDIDSSEVSLSGLVKFVVLQVHSVCHLSVRLIEVIDKMGKRTTFENFTREISDKLQAFFKLEENRTFVGAVEVNKLCAVEREGVHGKRFERGRIVELQKFNKLNKVTEVLVKFVDSGQMSRISVYKLFELSENLKNYSPQAMDIFLCDLLPNDFDRAWNEEAVFSAKSLFMKPLGENQFWIGRIRLALKNSLLLESVTLCRFLENLKTHVIDFSARRKFLAQRIAVENGKHLEKLQLLCEKANIKPPSYEVEEDKVIEGTVEPQWAFLDGNLPRVEFISADNTSCLYLRMAKFSNLLAKLEKECQRVADEMKISRDAKKWTDKWTPNAGTYCLALYEDSWTRGKILSAVQDKFLVFFIDYGDCHYIHDLLPIPVALLTELPAQAIECSLVGVKHNAAISDRVLDEIYSFSNGGADDLYASVICKSEGSEKTGGWKYQVNLIDAGGTSLSRALVATGLVEAEENSFHLAQNMDITVTGLEDERDAIETSADDEVDFVTGSCPDQDHLKLVQSEEDPLYNDNTLDNMFDDENAQLMIEEFMAHVFPRSANKSEELQGVKMEIHDGRLEAEVTKMSEPPGRQNEVESDTDSKFKRAEKDKAVSYIPQIIWCQNHMQIRIKIVLNNAERYRLSCSAISFLFRCLVEEKLYVADLKLFGSVNPHLTEVQVKPFYVQVILKKLCPLQWPRLTRDRYKYRWIKFDIEEYAGEQSSYVEEICKRALAEIKCGQFKQRRVEGGDIQLVPSTDSDDGSDSVSDVDDGDDYI